MGACLYQLVSDEQRRVISYASAEFPERESAYRFNEHGYAALVPPTQEDTGKRWSRLVSILTLCSPKSYQLNEKIEQGICKHDSYNQDNTSTWIKVTLTLILTMELLEFMSLGP